MSEELRSNDRRALQMINRFPVKEAVVEGVVDDSESGHHASCWRLTVN